MHRIDVLTGKGHETVAEWETTDTELEAKARAIFDELMNTKGYAPVAVDMAIATKEGTQVLVPAPGSDTMVPRSLRHFDPRVETWLFIPPVKGG